MRSAIRILVIVMLGVAAGALLAAAIPNWPAPPTWTPTAGVSKAKSGVKTALATLYQPVPLVPLTPCRLADTRAGSGFPAGYGPPSISGGTQRTFTITGQCGIPSGASAVSFNFAVWGPVTRGDLRVWPAGGSAPMVSTVNWEANILAIANAAVVPLSGGGQITVQVDGTGTIDLIVDVNGYYSNDVSSSALQDLFLTSSGAFTVYAVNTATNSMSVVGIAAGTGSSWGIYGFSGSTAGSGYGVYGTTPAGTAGVLGTSSSGVGVQGSSASSVGVKGTSSASNGVRAESTNQDGLFASGGRDGLFATGARTGVNGSSSGTTGLLYGVIGTSASTSAGSGGVCGVADAVPTNPALDLYGKVGVLGVAAAVDQYAVAGVTNAGWGAKFVSQNAAGTAVNSKAYLAASYGAAYFGGDVSVYAAGSQAGNLSVAGTLSKGGGSFRIDHPLDPENKYLFHSFVESPDMKNVSDGVVELGPDGSAVVKLPDYFHALNKEFRYQLTALGMAQPDLHVALEIANNEFVIAGGKAYARVSWQVTGIRKDPFANAHRIVPEVEKEAGLKGYFLHPAENGQPVEKSLGPRMLELQKAREAELAGRPH